MISGVSNIGIQFDPQAMQEHRAKVFERIDSNSDGSLDKSELQTMADRISEMRGKTVSVDDILARMDSDGDSLVSKAEHEATPPPKPEGMAGAMPPMPQGGGNIMSLLEMLNEDSEESDNSYVGLLQYYQNEAEQTESLFDMLASSPGPIGVSDPGRTSLHY